MPESKSGWNLPVALPPIAPFKGQVCERQEKLHRRPVLLTNRSIKLSATAKTQLRSGNIDPRLPELIALMVHDYPLRIVDFGDHSPGGGPASLLRSMDLATASPPAHLTPSAYIHWMRSFIQAQRSQYHPVLSLVTLPTGQTVLRIGYGAPSPLDPQAS